MRIRQEVQAVPWSPGPGALSHLKEGLAARRTLVAPAAERRGVLAAMCEQGGAERGHHRGLVQPAGGRWCHVGGARHATLKYGEFVGHGGAHIRCVPAPLHQQIGMLGREPGLGGVEHPLGVREGASWRSAGLTEANPVYFERRVSRNASSSSYRVWLNPSVATRPSSAIS